MNTGPIGKNIDLARNAAGLSQRALADVTGISQPTLSRIIAGTRTATMPEIILIAEATGTTAGQLAGTSDIATRVQYAARATNGSGMHLMRERLLHFIKLNDYLEDQAIPTPY